MTTISIFQTSPWQQRHPVTGVLGWLFEVMSLFTLFISGYLHKQLVIPHFSKLNLLPCSYGFFHWCLAFWSDSTLSFR